MQLKLQIIVAACTNRGIGINNSLPWKLPGDMAFFRKVTSETTLPGLKNALIMGRKTWDSIPTKLKPLKNRLNVVISRTLELPDIDRQFHVSKSFESALDFLSIDKSIDKIFVIGGSSIYDLALKSDACYNIFLTKINKEFECDTFLSTFDEVVFKPINLPGLDRSIHNENDVEYQFNCYHKIRNTIDDVKTKDNLPLYSVVAMDTKRGIGYQNGLPWPPISKDFQHYLSLVRGAPSDRTAVIIGRLSWESMRYEERLIKGAVYIVVGTKKDQISYPDLICSIAQTFEEAVCLAADLMDDRLVNRIFVLGGTRIYKEAIDSDLCKVLYVTRIYESYPSEAFMPEFEHKYVLDGSTMEDYNVIHEENGIKLMFQVYKLPQKNSGQSLDGDK